MRGTIIAMALVVEQISLSKYMAIARKALVVLFFVHFICNKSRYPYSARLLFASRYLPNEMSKSELVPLSCE